MTEAVDVLIIGAGPAGGAAAIAVAGRGLSVLLVERKKAIGVPVQCAEFIPLPLGSRARADGVFMQRISGMKSILPSGTIEETGFPGLMIDRARFDQALAESASAAGAQVWTHSRLDRLDEDTAHIARANRSRSSVTYKVLIGADGPHSTVAELLGLPPLETVNTRQYTVELKHAYADTDIWLSPDYPGGYAWLFPKNREANLGLGADKRFLTDLKRPLDALHRQLAKTGLVGSAIRARTGGAIPVGGMRERLVVANAIFAGDAAGLTHPITGGGIAAAVASGEAAGQAAAEFITGDADALYDYDGDMRDQFSPTLERAVARRRWLNERWVSAAASADTTHRRGWIAFPEYFAPDRVLLSG